MFPEVSAPWSLPAATKECLLFLKLDGFNCCGTAAAKKAPTPFNMHTQALSYIKSLKSGRLIMLIANCSAVVMCLLSELMCFLLLRHKAACLRVLCEIAAPEGKRTAPSSILPNPLPLDREEDKYCCRCLTLHKWDFSSQIYQALAGCLRLQNLALGMIKWQHMFLNHPPPCYCQRVMMIPSSFLFFFFLLLLLCSSAS